MRKICTIVENGERCENVNFGHGMCGKHYNRWRTHGDPLNAGRQIMEKREHEKWCSGCKVWLPKDRFGKASRRIDGLEATCRDCKIYARYGITREAIEEMLAQQNGGCAICGTREPGGRFGSWHIDHDHACCSQKAQSCGKCVRALLCHRCNVGLGQFQDSSHLLFAAAGYLQRYDRAFAVSPQ